MNVDKNSNKEELLRLFRILSQAQISYLKKVDAENEDALDEYVANLRLQVFSAVDNLPQVLLHGYELFHSPTESQ